jgi:RNA polymerase sigma-70 factor (ECF subfamily)
MKDNKILRSFNSLYTANYHRAFMLVKRYVHDGEAAEDIVSEVMIKLWQMMQDTTLESEEAMLYTMLRNSSLNYLKHQQSKEEALETVTDALQRELQLRISSLEDSTPSLTLLNEINNLLQLSLSQMPELTQRIFKMSRYDGKTNKEIAEILHLSQKSVEYHITKSLRELRSQLRDYLPLNLWPIILFFV